MLLIQNMFPVAFISPKNWINCREIGINLITTRASFQSTEKHNFYSRFFIRHKCANVTHGKDIQSSQLCIFERKSKDLPFFQHTELEHIPLQGKSAGFTKNVVVGNLKLLFRTLVFKVETFGT